MSHILEQDRSGLFTVVGAAPLAEEHRDARDHYHLDAIRSTSAFVAGVWLTLYVAILVVAIAGKDGVGSAIETITAALVR